MVKRTSPSLAPLGEVAVAYLTRLGARFDLAARADDRTLRALLVQHEITPWPVLFAIERAVGGLRFADWRLGCYGIATAAPKLRVVRTTPVPLVCVGGNDTGPLYADEAGQIWDADAAAGSLRLRADSMLRRLVREAYCDRIGVLRQRCHAILAREVGAAAGAKRLGVPLIRAASDRFERVWQSAALTIVQTTEDVRVFAKTAAALRRAVKRLS